MKPTSPLVPRALSWAPFVGTAALVALGIHYSLQSPWLGLALGLVAGALLVPRLLARQRSRRLLLGGNIDALLESWQPALERMPNRETMAPLLTATALAAHGLTARARQTLRYVDRGDAWEAALEHRLILETLLDAFEGERERAVSTAERLASLPLPATNPWLRARVSLLREATGALARAFARSPKHKDLGTLVAGAKNNPLLHWSLRYAAAAVCIEQGKPTRARPFLVGAPTWPTESVFSDIHAELEGYAAGESVN